MIKRQFPSVSQVNAAFFITAVLTLISSIVSRPRLGLGTNLWINEYVYLLFAPLLLAFLNSWPLEDVYRLKEAPRLSLLLSIPAAICVWPFAAYASRGAKSSSIDMWARCRRWRPRYIGLPKLYSSYRYDHPRTNLRRDLLQRHGSDCHREIHGQACLLSSRSDFRGVPCPEWGQRNNTYLRIRHRHGIFGPRNRLPGPVHDLSRYSQHTGSVLWRLSRIISQHTDVDAHRSHGSTSARNTYFAGRTSQKTAE